MEKKLLALAMFMLLASPIFAWGNVTITGNPFATFGNTNSSVDLLNFSINVVPGTGDNTTNITAINITILGASPANGSVGNISAITIRNATGFVLGANTSLNPANNVTYTIFLNIPLFANATSRNQSFVVNVNISGTARHQLNVSMNISSPNDIMISGGSANISLLGTTHGVQIQDLHANVSLLPRFVDTSVINQSLVFRINPTGIDNITNVFLQVPSMLSNLVVANVTLDASNLTSQTTIVSGNNITIVPAVSTGNRIEIYFTANITSTTGTGVFNATVSGGNFTNISTSLEAQSTNILSAQPIFNVSDIKIVKGAAIANGTDYWEFNFTLNATANISPGTLQFKLFNWSNAESGTLSIFDNNCPGGFCATLRNDTNFTANFSAGGKFNVSNDYSMTNGIQAPSMQTGGLFSVILRMIVPLGTPVSSTWQTTYGILFRSYA